MKRFKFDQDTGFGTLATTQGDRLINNDGTYNVVRTGVPFFTRINLYHDMIKIPWWMFHLFVLTAFIAINTLYTFIYMIIGLDELQGINSTSFLGRCFEIFTFSAQTLTTVG
jgi:inward rectifier potassium channel